MGESGVATEVNIEELIEALRRPEAYAHAPDSVSLLQTHASVIFFAGDRVYKVKKPVDYGFLDFSTFERRKRFCEEEVRLNRRLAPRVYLGVVRITRDGGGRIGVDGDGEAVEHAVEMRRLPAERMLDRLLDRGEVGETDLDAIADRIAAFHKDARCDDEVRAFGAPEAIAKRIETNLDECAALAGDLPEREDADAPALTTATLERLRAWSAAQLRAQRELLAARAAGGRVREGHGDLHAGNICLPEGGGVVAYDCIEFEASFRCLDVAAELAFLAMDLERRGFVEQAAHLVDRYATATGDAELRDLQALYRCHYACVRGKVSALRARNPQVDGDARREAWREAAGYFHLALGYTLPALLVVMSGLPGTGKSWWAARLGAALRARVVRSDEVRKRLAGMAPTERARSEDEQNKLYSEYITKQTYDKVAARGREALRAGRSAVLDATAPTPAMRAQLLGSAGDAPSVVAWCDCPEATVLERLGAREAAGDDPSDAGVEVYLAARARFEPPTPSECIIIRLDCRGAPWRGVDEVLGRLAGVAPIPEL